MYRMFFRQMCNKRQRRIWSCGMRDSNTYTNVHCMSSVGSCQQDKHKRKYRILLLQIMSIEETLQIAFQESDRPERVDSQENVCTAYTGLCQSSRPVVQAFFFYFNFQGWCYEFSNRIFHQVQVRCAWSFPGIRANCCEQVRLRNNYING